MNMIICVCACIGSEIPQNLCIISVTGTRNSTINQAPSLARYPSKMLNPPTNAGIPENGTAIDANGTPCEAANAIVCPEKCLSPDAKKIKVKRNHPRTTTAPFAKLVSSAPPEIAAETTAMTFLLFRCACCARVANRIHGVGSQSFGLELRRNLYFMSIRPSEGQIGSDYRHLLNAAHPGCCSLKAGSRRPWELAHSRRKADTHGYSKVQAVTKDGRM